MPEEGEEIMSKRPVVYVKDENPLTPKQIGFLKRMIVDRFASPEGEEGWNRTDLFDMCDRRIIFKNMSQDYFGELIHCLRFDISSAAEGTMSNPETGVDKYYPTLGDLFKSLIKYKCMTHS